MGAFVVPVVEAGLAASRTRSMPAAPRQRPRSTVSSSPMTALWASPAARPPPLGTSLAPRRPPSGLAPRTVGTCDALFQIVLAYVKDRKQFGVPIGSFQAVKHKMSNMFLSIERARGLSYFAVASINEDTPIRATAVSMAKAASDDCQRLVGRESIQILGGIGFDLRSSTATASSTGRDDGALRPRGHSPLPLPAASVSAPTAS